MVLHRLVAVGADRGRHHQPDARRSCIRRISSAISAKNCSAFWAGVGGEQLLGLIQRQHQAWAPAASWPASASRFARRGCALRPAARTTAGVVEARVFDLPQRRPRRCQTLGGAAWIGAAKPVLTGQRVPLRAHDVQHHESAGRRAAAAASTPPAETTTCRYPDGPSTTNSDFEPRDAHRPQRHPVPRTIGRVPPEKHPGVDVFERLPAPIRRPLAGSRLGGQTKFSGPTPLPSIAFLSRCSAAVLNRTGAPPDTAISVCAPSANRSQRCHSAVMSVRRGPPAARTRSACPGSRRCGTRSGIRASFPASRQQADHRFAPVVGLAQRLFPPLTRPQPSLRTDVKKDLVGQLWPLLRQPLL